MSKLKIPEVGEYVRGIGRLILVTQNERDGGTDYIFEDVTAKTQACLRGKVISEFGESWDFIGHLSSVQATCDDALGWMKKMEVNPREPNHVRVVMCRSLSRKRPKTGQSDEYCRNFYNHQYRAFEQTSGCRWRLPENQSITVWDSAESETLDMDAVRAIAAKPWEGLPASVMPCDTVKVTARRADEIGACHSCRRRESDDEPLRVFELMLGGQVSIGVRVCKPCARALVRQLSDAIGKDGVQ